MQFFNVLVSNTLEDTFKAPFLKLGQRVQRELKNMLQIRQPNYNTKFSSGKHVDEMYTPLNNTFV